jgi:beta-galactosidase
MDKYELHAQNTAFRFFIIPLKAGVKAAEAARIDMPVCQPVTVERQSTGRIKMSTTTKNATIWYSIEGLVETTNARNVSADGSEFQKYTTPLLHNEACTIRAYSSADGLMDSPVMEYAFDLYINKSGWKVVSADSYQGGNEAKLAVDGNNGTFWHTAWGNNEPQCPHTIVIDMAKIYNVTACTYLARQDGNQNGMVKGYEFYLSTDGKTWGQAVATGEFKNTTATQVAKLKSATNARYMKFVAKSEVNDNAWTSAAEISIQAASDVTAIENIPPLSHGVGAVYNLQGRRMDGPAHRGVYIQNGKKIVKGAF